MKTIKLVADGAAQGIMDAAQSIEAAWDLGESYGETILPSDDLAEQMDELAMQIGDMFDPEASVEHVMLEEPAARVLLKELRRMLVWLPTEPDDREFYRREQVLQAMELLERENIH